MSAVFVFWGCLMSHVMNTYARLPVAFSHGQGSRITDTEGKEYLDALSGIAVSTLGHAHPKLVAAIAAQAGRVLHTSNLYGIPGQDQLSDKLASLSGMQEVFFCNSGCEANEAAIKLARFYGHKKGIETPTIIVMEKAFHGRTMATLSATGNRKAQAGFEPLVSGFVRVPYDDLDAIKAVAEHNKNIVAIMLEIIQGEGGIHLAAVEFQKGLAPASGLAISTPGFSRMWRPWPRVWVPGCQSVPVWLQARQPGFSDREIMVQLLVVILWLVRLR